jgi:5'-3' exonuclease
MSKLFDFKQAEPVIVFDSNAVGHALRHKLGDLTYGEKEVGVIFGFINSISKYAEKFGTGKFVFTWDSKKSLRKIAYPSYKANRKKDYTEEEQELYEIAMDQFREIQYKILPELGFANVFCQTGLEGDDLIASIVTHNEDEDFIVISSDNDLYQLLDRCSMFLSKRKTIYTKRDFELEFGISPKDWALVKMLAGCPGDNVKGITGIGIKSAIKYLKQSLSGAYLGKVLSHKDQIIEQNRDLVTLPHPKTKVFTLQSDELSIEAYMNICYRYNFNHLLKPERMSVWAKYLVREKCPKEKQ